MLKLGELKKQVQMVECGERVPTVKALMRMGSPVVVKEVLGKSVEITVFRNGYVLYMAEGRKTVFPLHDCSGYRYESASRKTGTFDLYWKGKTGCRKIRMCV